MIKKKLNFAFIGVAGYIAPRHLNSIYNLNHNLILSYDISDNVGILDKFFPKCLFFKNYNEFKKNFYKLRKKINFTIITTPNFTHYKFIKFALSNGSNVICEKPLVLSMYQFKQIEILEKKYKKKVFNILQLRTFDEVKKIKKKISLSKKYNINIRYITPRGMWYNSSWKGNVKKSGGIIFNIGIHLLDLLCYLFGRYQSCKIIELKKDLARGTIEFGNAKAKFYLSIKQNRKRKVVRDFIINNKKINLVKNFEKAHIDCYRDIIKYKKFNLTSIKNSIKLAEELNK